MECWATISEKMASLYELIKVSLQRALLGYRVRYIGRYICIIKNWRNNRMYVHRGTQDNRRSWGPWVTGEALLCAGEDRAEWKPLLFPSVKAVSFYVFWILFHVNCYVLKTNLKDYPAVQRLGLQLLTQGVRVQSLVKEIITHMPWGQIIQT